MKGTVRENCSAVRQSRWLNVACLLVLPLLDMTLMEWVHRGSFSVEFWTQQLAPARLVFSFGWLFLVFVYGVLCMAFGRHWPAQLILSVVCFGFGAATYPLKLQMRGEPLLPWDFSPAWRVLRRGQQGKPVYPVALLCGWGLFCRAVRA